MEKRKGEKEKKKKTKTLVNMAGQYSISRSDYVTIAVAFASGSIPASYLKSLLHVYSRSAAYRRAAAADKICGSKISSMRRGSLAANLRARARCRGSGIVKIARRLRAFSRADTRSLKLRSMIGET